MEYRDQEQNNASTIPENLKRLSELYGIQLDYWDVYGKQQYATSEALLSVLSALGVRVSTEEEIEQAIRDYQRNLWLKPLQPVLVAWDGGSINVQVRLWEENANRIFKVTIESLDIESKDDKPRTFTVNTAELQEIDSAEIDGKHYALKQFRTPGSLPYGYYSFCMVPVADDAHEFNVQNTLLISAPPQVPQLSDTTRLWGGFLPLYSMQSKNSWGIGDYGDLKKLTDFIASKGGAIVGTLPMLPAFLPVSDEKTTEEITQSEEPYEYSPYSPVSRLFWNEVFIDVEAIPDLEKNPVAKKIIKSKEFQSELNKVRESEFVEYLEVMALKRKVLWELAKKVTRSRSKRGLAFKEFVKNNPEITEYAQFRAVTEKQQQSWHVWDERLKSGKFKRTDYDNDVVRYHQYVQWIAREQINEVGKDTDNDDMGLYLDLPLGVNPSGYDLFRYRDSFAFGASAGAPPDLLFSGGQDWGFAPLHPQNIRENHYEYFIKVLRHHLHNSRYIRIDHVMGFHRLYFVPPGMDARSGVYVTYPANEIYALICLEAHRTNTIIIGEDLGTVPENVREAMHRHGLNRMHILELEITPEEGDTLPEIPGNSLCGLNTHDLPTFEGFCNKRDFALQNSLAIMSDEMVETEKVKRDQQVSRLESTLRKEGFLEDTVSEEALLDASLSHLAVSKSKMLMVNLEDLWLESNTQNLPGTWRERENWRRKARYKLEQIIESDAVNSYLENIVNWRKSSIPGLGNLSAQNMEMISSSQKVPATRPDDLELTDFDLFLFNEGSHFRLYERLGAHQVEINGETYTRFAVWAPEAAEVFVMGDFNDWLNQTDLAEVPEYRLSPRGHSGIWEGFVRNVEKGDKYKYLIQNTTSGDWFEKADPFAFRTEEPPRTASVLWDLDYEWNDSEWMENRKQKNDIEAPMSIYEVHPGSWRRIPEEGNRSLTYREMAPYLIDHVKRMGFTHIEFLPLTEHPFYGSWGYQTTAYFAPTARYGTPQDFMYLIDELHKAGIGVIMDWVPSHFPNDAHGLAQFDGSHLFEHSDPRQGIHPDWNTCIFNYARHEVRGFLISSALFWLDKYHIDGIRIDAVASMLYLDYSRGEGEWIPNKFGGRENIEAIDFLRRMNIEIYKNYPDVQTFAEESTSWSLVTRPTDIGGLGFGFKWDMGWMHDTLEYIRRDPLFRRYHHNEMTFRMLYAFHENFCLPLSHDEVVHMKGSLLGRLPGSDEEKFANLRLLYSYMYAQPGKKLLFMGGEFGQWAEWDHDSSLEWHLTEYPPHQGIMHLLQDLNRLYVEEPALHQLDHNHEGFEWISADDAEISCYSFLRKDRDGSLVVAVFNFTPVAREGYVIGVPHGGFWREIFNSNSEYYGGTGAGNDGGLNTIERKVDDRFDHALEATLPPLSAVFLKLER